MIRIMIVDDSIVVRRTLREIFGSQGGFEVVCEAANGNEAIYYAQKFRPDIITMDIHMPGGNGFMAIDKILSEFPIPIMILTASSNASENENIFNVMKYGLVDIFEKPDITEWEKNPSLKMIFFQKIHELASAGRNIQKVEKKKTFSPGVIEAVGVVSSTGGPKILKEIFANLNMNIRVPILCVQHISAGFSTGLVKWLQGTVKMEIRTAQAGERLRGGIIYFPPDDHHIEITRNMKVSLNQKPPIFGLRPAGDYLLESMSELKQGALGVILTGMGSDGTEGMRHLHMAGGWGIAQDQKTSIVWGMPKSAIDSGYTDEVMDPAQITERLNMLI